MNVKAMTDRSLLDQLSECSALARNGKLTPEARRGRMQAAQEIRAELKLRSMNNPSLREAADLASQNVETRATQPETRAANRRE